MSVVQLKPLCFGFRGEQLCKAGQDALYDYTLRGGLFVFSLSSKNLESIKLNAFLDDLRTQGVVFHAFLIMRNAYHCL